MRNKKESSRRNKGPETNCWKREVREGERPEDRTVPRPGSKQRNEEADGHRGELCAGKVNMEQLQNSGKNVAAVQEEYREAAGTTTGGARCDSAAELDDLE